MPLIPPLSSGQVYPSSQWQWHAVVKRCNCIHTSGLSGTRIHSYQRESDGSVTQTAAIYEFRIRQPDSPSGDPGFPVFIDASTGDPYIPGQESARISAVQAKNLVREAFLIPDPDSIRIRYDNSPDSARAWIFTVQQDNRTRISGSLDPDTGQIVSFSRTVSRQGRQADPVLDISAAQKIADRYIIDRNGAPLPVNMSEVPV